VMVPTMPPVEVWDQSLPGANRSRRGRIRNGRYERHRSMYRCNI
jgi:hypothetical protein